MQARAVLVYVKRCEHANERAPQFGLSPYFVCRLHLSHLEMFCEQETHEACLTYLKPREEDNADWQSAPCLLLV